MIRRATAFLVSASTLLVGLAAQGNLCSQATPIQGLGTFAFDTTQATTTGFNGNFGCPAPSDFIHQDVFWQWTVPAAGDYSIDTFGSNFDTKLSVHLGAGCSAACLQFNDNDGGGSQSQVILFGLSAGQSVLIQTGGALQESGLGALTIANYSDPCLGLSPDALEENDDCFSAPTIAPGTYLNLNILDTDWDYYSIAIPAGHQLYLEELYDDLGLVQYVLFEPGCFQYLRSGTSDLRWTNATNAPVVRTLQVRRSLHPLIACSEYGFQLSLGLDRCLTTPDDALDGNDDCASATVLADGLYPGLFVSGYDKDFYRFCLGAGESVSCTLLFASAEGDIDAYLRAADSAQCGTGSGSDLLAASTSGDDHESIQWTNTTGTDLELVLEVNLWEASDPQCNVYDLALSRSGACGGPEAGIAFCDPMDPHSGGGSTRLRGRWGSGQGSDLSLEVTHGPAQQFGYFLVGSNSPGIGIGQGRLCLDLQSPSVVGRYNLIGTDRNSVGRFNGAGVFENWVNTASDGLGFDVPMRLPLGGAVAIQSGQTWHFQLWHRDLGGQANFSNALTVQF